MADDSDDDVPQLSAEALAALQEFYESVDESKQGNGTAIEENWVKRNTFKPLCFRNPNSTNTFLAIKSVLV